MSLTGLNKVFEEDQELKKQTEVLLGECREGLEIEAQFLVYEAIFNTFIDYLADIKRKPMHDVSSSTMSVLNTMVEKHNLGSKRFIDKIRGSVTKKFAPKKPSEKLLINLTTSLAKADPRYTTARVKAAMESCNVNEPNATDEGLAISRHFFHKYGTDTLKLFPRDFVEYLK